MAQRTKIPNDLAAQFNTVEGRKTLIQRYGCSDEPYFGVNEDGEDVIVSFDTEDGIVIRTNQSNGWVRVNYYDKDGYATAETFDGKWR